MKTIFYKDRLLRINANKVINLLENSELILYDSIQSYLLDYLNFYNIDMENVFKIIKKFQENYSEDIKNYLETNKYPYQLNNHFEITRVEYDIVLISSVLLSQHRFNIIKTAHDLKLIGDIAVIGIGSGIELEFLDSVKSKIEAYDLSISDFAKTRFSNAILYEKKFELNLKKYDCVLALELLEHLEDPFILINDIFNSLNEKGRFVFTTTTNVPQFDHLYDFDNELLDKEVQKIGFKIIMKDKISHTAKFDKVNAYNTFYIVEK